MATSGGLAPLEFGGEANKINFQIYSNIHNLSPLHYYLHLHRNLHLHPSLNLNQEKNFTVNFVGGTSVTIIVCKADLYLFLFASISYNQLEKLEAAKTA